ncbi:WD40 repeat domain-containing protein [Streptomyces sp. NPDC057638]|uniref:WD40 repeat domain-containing protein n=1 Tax=Streptomyces sp. NPDC057638 TaxID=3346190 RepID=UPI003695BECD
MGALPHRARVRRLPRTLVITVLVGLCAAACTTGGRDGPAGSPSASADRQSVGQRLASQSLRLAEKDARLSVALALEAAGLAHTPDVAAALSRLRSPHPVSQLKREGAPVRAMSFSGEGRFLLAGDAGGQVRVWDVYSGRTRLTGRVRGAVTEAALSYGGDLAAARGARGGLTVWNVRTGKTVRTFADAPGGAQGLTFVPAEQERLAFGGRGGTVEVRDVRSWNRETTIRPAGGSAALTWFLDGGKEGTVLSSLSTRGTLEAWSLDGGRRLGAARVPGPGAAAGPYVLDSRTDDHGVLSLSSTTWTVSLRTLLDSDRSGSVFRRLPRDISRPVTLTSRLMGTDPAGGSVLLWEMEDPLPHRRFSPGAEIALPTRPGRITALTGYDQPTGMVGQGAPTKRLPVAVGTEDGSVTFWDLAEGPEVGETEKAVKEELFQLCSGTPLILTPAEWRKLIPELPYAPACVRTMKERGTAGHD